MARETGGIDLPLSEREALFLLNVVRTSSVSLRRQLKETRSLHGSPNTVQQPGLYKLLEAQAVELERIAQRIRDRLS